MSVDGLIRVLALVTLVEMMVMMGLGVSISQIQEAVKNGRMLLGAILACYVVVPLVALGLVVSFHPRPIPAAGFLMVAVCSGAPSGPQFARMAKGDTSVALGITAILAALSTVIAPVSLHLLLPLVPGEQPLRIDVPNMVVTLFLSLFVPLCAGLAVRYKWAELAHKLEKPAKQLGLLLSLLLVTAILSIQWHRLATIRIWENLSLVLFVTLTFAICWRLGSYIPKQRAVTAATSVRNISAALVLATCTFPGTLAVTASAVYALYQIGLLMFLFILWGTAPPDVRARTSNTSSPAGLHSKPLPREDEVTKR